MNTAILGTDKKLCDKIANHIREGSKEFKEMITIRIFDKAEDFVRQSSMNMYSFDLVIVYLDQSDAIINCMKIMKNQKACFNYLCIGQSEQQLYKLYHIGICGFVYEKDIDKQLIPQLERIISETHANGSEKLPFEIYDDVDYKAYIPVSEILFFKVEGRIIHITTVSGTYRLKTLNFAQLMEQMQPFGFVQANRSHLVNIRHMKSIAGLTLQLDGGYEIEISRRKQKYVKSVFMAQGI